MQCELVCSQRSIGQTSEVGAEFVAKGEEAGGPGIEDSCSCAVTGPLKNSVEDRTADGGSNEAATILVDSQSGGLGHEVPGRFVVFSPFEKRLEPILVERWPDKVTKRPGRELKQMRRVAQRVLDPRQIACRNHLNTTKPNVCRQRLDIIVHRIYL